MKPAASQAAPLPLTTPVLLPQAKQLVDYVQSLPLADFKRVMNISENLAKKTKQQFDQWNTQDGEQTAAVQAFIGDIYSGLQANTWSDTDRAYAQKHVRILSGLYGILRPYDGICPYRLEMGYRLPHKDFSDLYAYWGSTIAHIIPANIPIINLASVEYSKAITPFINKDRIITPVFLTISPKTGRPRFVAVHAKIARGAFASWVIVNQVTKAAGLRAFNGIGYRYDATLSTPNQPTYICQEFGGKGLSLRLK